ncbi:MAG: error-prone DNA polymerase [Gammaproteobacteria bacterium]|nr:error-prone DNA polymerase [Gammaproteobacteria bacterium]MBU1555841.1 error-prone DNA polymerase [Gammaproteobacteria bacterium]MBU2071306.1 error-prone DNA polymerase [Gammaproteobacteria bacterium]MBU2181713.1 error-prone DNA polymerase [Gammaproteobacteria bacterium]MBU2205299.1 error-prone DNA polymerase [Gammaproteobacteria bacterium]
MAYAELFCQSHFSFLHGASSPQELVQQAAALGYEALALTDECSVAGIVRAYRQINQQQLNIKLIVGSYFQLDKLELVLLCPDKAAYAELCRVISNARRRSSKGEYCLTEWDLMSLQHCLLLWLPAGDSDSDTHWANWLQKYHRERLWLAMRRELNHNETAFNHYCQQLARQHQLSVVACGAVLMHVPERLALQHCVSAIKAGKPIAELGRQLLSNAERALRPLAKLEKLFSTELLQQSCVIAARCTFSLEQLKYQYPSELVPDGETAAGYLARLVARGSQVRFPDGITKRVQAIIDKEMALITELNYEYFFLTIYDLVQFAKARGILYQGRGSAANSVVCYCLEITAVDPEKIQVLFERFLSRERQEPPDIDVDFEHERREEVIQYLYQKYGRERAALAATVISYRFKSALRDVGKALGLPISQLDFLVKNIQRRDPALSWQQQLAALGLNSNSQTTQQLVTLVEQLRGAPRHLSQHVGGFVISQGPLYELVPVENAAMADRTVIQWDKDDLETLQLLKVDVLALGMLTAIRKCFTLLKQHQQQDLSIAGISARGDDAAVYQMLQKADTVGVFQIESRAQMSMLPRLKPACYYDLVVQIAIVRPGPIQGDMVHPYLKRRDGKEAVSYPSEAVKDVLARTLGVPIFQEQVIALAMVAAGFSGGEADQLRRAMASWQKTGELLQFKHKLIDGMQRRGYPLDFAERIYQQICGFGEYGFPESHSASFAVLAYVSAWLKHYYPAAFCTALLNSYPMGFYSPAQLLQDARRHGVELLPLCVNQSQWDYCLQQQGKAIRLGLRQVKGLSSAGAQLLLQLRPSGGYRDITQLRQTGLSRGDLQALASANVLSSISGDRYNSRWQLLDTQHSLPLFATEPERQSTAAQVAQTTPAYLAPPGKVEEMLEDYAATGLTLATHPLALLRQATKLPRSVPVDELYRVRHNSPVRVSGLVTLRQRPGTAAGVTFMSLEDETGTANVLVWLATAQAQQKSFLTATILQVDGILQREGEVTHIIAGKLVDLSALLAELKLSSRDFH